MERYDAIIVGAGMVGLACALALAEENFKVAIVESKTVNLHSDESEREARVSAINPASLNLLKKLGILSKIPSSKIAPLVKMQVWDESGGGQIEFDSSEVGLPELGSIIANQDILRAAWASLGDHKNVSFHNEAPINITREPQEIILEFPERKIAAHLIVAADGINSWVRKTLEIEAEMKSYSQSGIIALIETEKPHGQCALQNFLPTGPLGVLPLKNPNEMAIVWSADSDYAKQLLTMDVPSFNSALQAALANKLGSISLISERQEFPLVASHAKQYCQERVVLIGDAAHTIHPLAGQGVNLGFKDVEVLLEAILEAREKRRDIGIFRVLRSYERARKLDNKSMLASMRGFKAVFGSKNAFLIQLRSFGFSVVNRCAPLKKLFMEKALGGRS